MKVERALKMMSEDFQGDDDDEDQDQEMAFITKAVKKFWKKNQFGDPMIHPIFPT